MKLNLSIYLYIMVSGLIMGSFLCCWAYRVCHSESIVKGCSKCDSCGHRLKPADLIPVVSYMLNKGKCRYCDNKINIRYPLYETICAIVYCLIAGTFGLNMKTVQYIILFSACLAISFSDMESYSVPPVFIIIGLINRLVFILIYNIGCYNLSGGLVSIGVYLISIIMKRITEKDVIGDGDIKLLFMLGIYCDWYRGVLALFIASLFGMIFALLYAKKYKENIFPFAPFICIGYMITLLFINNI